MKYFTIDWWSKGGSGSSEVFTQYADHLEQIRSELPGSVQRFVEDVSLHDARLTSMRADFATATLTLSLDGYAAPTGRTNGFHYGTRSDIPMSRPFQPRRILKSDCSGHTDSATSVTTSSISVPMARLNTTSSSQQESSSS